VGTSLKRGIQASTHQSGCGGDSNEDEEDRKGHEDPEEGAQGESLIGCRC